MNYSDENIGKAFKEAFEGFEIKPSDSVWESVNNTNLKAGVTKPLAQFSRYIYGVVATAILVSSVYLLYSYNTKSTNAVNTVENNVVDVIEHNNQNDNVFADTIVDQKVDNQENVEDKSRQELTAQKESDSKKERSSQKAKKVLVSNCGNQPIVSEEEAFASVDSMENKTILEDDGDNIVYNEEYNSENNIIKEQEVSNINTGDVSGLNGSNEIIKGAKVDTFNVKYSENPIICFGEDAVLWAEEGYHYLWNTGERGNSISVSPIANSYYELTVTNSNGQKNIHTFSVSVDKECSALILPSAFTPNGDGKNDVFKAEGIGITKLLLTVYSSLGQMMFETRSIDQAWDGRYKGEIMPANIYFYQASYMDAKGKDHIKRGQITLIR